MKELINTIPMKHYEIRSFIKNNYNKYDVIYFIYEYINDIYTEQCQVLIFNEWFYNKYNKNINHLLVINEIKNHYYYNKWFDKDIYNYYKYISSSMNTKNNNGIINIPNNIITKIRFGNIL